MKRKIAGKTVNIDEAEVVEEYSEGTLVRVSIKSYNSWATYNGIVVAIDPFTNLPAIHVMYIHDEYGAPQIKFAVVNDNSSEVEICPARAGSKLCDDTAMRLLDGAVNKARMEMEALEARREAFLAAIAQHNAQ